MRDIWEKGGRTTRGQAGITLTLESRTWGLGSHLPTCLCVSFRIMRILRRANLFRKQSRRGKPKRGQKHRLRLIKPGITLSNLFPYHNFISSFFSHLSLFQVQIYHPHPAFVTSSSFSQPHSYISPREFFILPFFLQLQFSKSQGCSWYCCFCILLDAKIVPQKENIIETN